MIASPQTEDGFTAIANELMIQICGIRIPGESRQVFDVILYKTYGWKKKVDWISLSQFEELTGIKKQNVKRAINKLLDMNMIFIKKDNDEQTFYGINKNYLTWEPLSKKITLSKKIKPVIKKDKASLSKKSTTKETNTKTTNTKEKVNKKEILDYSLLEINDDLLEEFKKHRKSKGAKETQRTINMLNNQLDILEQSGISRNEAIEEMIYRGWRSLKSDWILKDKNKGVVLNASQAKPESETSDFKRRYNSLTPQQQKQFREQYLQQLRLSRH